MSNIHGLGDLNNSQGNNRQYQRVPGGAGGPPPELDEEAKSAMVLFANGNGDQRHATKEPRQENYFDMWQTVFCPSFSPLKFTFMIWVVNTCVYIALLTATLVIGDYGLNPNVFLGPDVNLLNTWGCLNQYEIHENYEVWRLVTTLFLSPGFMVWGENSFLLLLIGFMVENVRMGVGKMAAIYFGIGILTSLFTVTCEPELSCGNIGVLGGLSFAMLAQLILNWKALEKVGNGSFRIIMIFLPVILFIFVLLMSFTEMAAINFQQQSPVSVGGGIIQGLGLGLIMMPYGPARPSPFVKMARLIGLGLLVIELVVLIPVFIWAINPRQLII